MKGTDVTEDQFNAAEDFITKFVNKHKGIAPSPDQKIVMTWKEFITIVAWYGMVRAIGVENGCPANEPGQVDFAANSPKPPVLKIVPAKTSSAERIAKELAEEFRKRGQYGT